MLRPKVFFLVLVTGCCLPKGPLPTVWTIPELKIRMEWISAEGDPRIERVKELSRAFNVRLFDALDGQIHVTKFSIWNENLLGRQAWGIGNVYEKELECAECTQHGHANGTPGFPKHFHIRLHEDASKLRSRAGTMFMEWCHSWTGTYDEYRTSTGAEAKCPEDLITRTLEDACIMYVDQHYSELCRPGTHGMKNEQHERHRMSCYEWIVKVIREAGKGELKIPEKNIPGPENPPEPSFEIHLR